jgi:Uma2 family endonuclease
MSAVQLMRDLLKTPASLVGLTVDQYHRMIAEGILEEGAPIELLDGFLVRKDRAKAGEDPMTVGLEHIWAVENLPEILGAAAKGQGCYVRVQQPITLPPDGEPEPDGAIVRGTKDDYRRRKPVAADVCCVIEVADSSLDRDRGTKMRIYADAGIEQYVIVNLVERVVEVYERPVRGAGRYDEPARLRGDEIVKFAAGQGRVEVVASKLLP